MQGAFLQGFSLTATALASMPSTLCHWFSGLEATLHHRALPAITFRCLLSLGILLTAENYSLACTVHTKHTIFSHLHLSKQVYIKTSGRKKREEEKETCAEGLFSCTPYTPTATWCHRFSLAVTQKCTWCSLICHSNFVFSWRVLHWVDRWWSQWNECNFSCLWYFSSMGFWRHSHGPYLSWWLRWILNYFPDESKPFFVGWKFLWQTFYISKV